MGVGWLDMEWKRNISHFSPKGSWSSETVNILLFLHSDLITNIIGRKLLGLVSLWMSMRHCLLWPYMRICWGCGWFFSFYNNTVACIVKFVIYLCDCSGCTFWGNFTKHLYIPQLYFCLTESVRIALVKDFTIPQKGQPFFYMAFACSVNGECAHEQHVRRTLTLTLTTHTISTYTR